MIKYLVRRAVDGLPAGRDSGGPPSTAYSEHSFCGILPLAPLRVSCVRGAIRLGPPLHRICELVERGSPDMKTRLFVCVTLAMVVAGALAFSSRLALAQDEPAKGQGPPPQPDRPRSGDAPADVDKALRAFDERMGKNLDKCR